MRIQLIKKENNIPQVDVVNIDNVVQLDFCNMQELGEDVSDGGWNFISIITKTNGELKKQIIKLENIWQFSLLNDKS